MTFDPNSWRFCCTHHWMKFCKSMDSINFTKVCALFLGQNFSLVKCNNPKFVDKTIASLTFNIYSPRQVAPRARFSGPQLKRNSEMIFSFCFHQNNNNKKKHSFPLDILDYEGTRRSKQEQNFMLLVQQIILTKKPRLLLRRSWWA